MNAVRAVARRYLPVLVTLLASAPAWVPPAVGAPGAPWVGTDRSGEACDGRGTGYGPYDYTNPEHFHGKLPIVEAHHFTAQVAALERGQGGGTVLANIDYTLRAFPNHHRALFSMIRLFTRAPRDPALDDWRTPPECYLRRAIEFAPDDHALYTLFGIYLHRLDNFDQAEQMYRKSLELDPRSAEAQYNLGLLLADLGHYEEARRHAREAYGLGYPLRGLRERLVEAGFPP